MKIDELARRRPNFAPGVGIRLEDGQEWTFPRPRVSWRHMSRDGVNDVVLRSSIGPEFDTAMRELSRVGALEEKSVVEVALALTNVGVALLSRNYDLTSEEIGDILIYAYDDPDSDDTWKEILDVARGNSKKVTAGGDS